MKNKNSLNDILLEHKLMTKWSKKVSKSCPLPEYPRPQFVRKNWLNLNGIWEYNILSKKIEYVEDFEGEILVPYPIESPLSGVERKLYPKEKLWYRRYFKIPETWNNQRIFLNFGAVDYKTTVWVNREKIGEHVGGYTPFSFEITEVLKFDEDNEIIISVWDPTGKGCQERGKQLLKPFSIFYTSVSGIWQTVWLEPRPESFIKNIKIYPDIDNKKVNIKIKIENPESSDSIRIYIIDLDLNIEKNVKLDENFIEFEINLDEPKLWSPDSPKLYNFTIELIKEDQVIDKVESYFGMRKISIGKDNSGIIRILLNNKITFQYGILDQGYWPDGLYTAPTDDALKYDIETVKNLGFNMIRKHVKIEPSRWYYYCDKIGLLVWQDMPNGGRYLFIGKKRNNLCKNNYYYTLKSMINSLFNHPSIVVWVPFNEGWGQFETKKVVEFIRNLDNTRLIDNASGWFDKKVGDIKDIHKYPGPKLPKLEENRAAVLGEFGGLGLKIENHIWKKNKHVFVYKKSSNKEKLLQNYIKLIDKLKPLIKKGLSAAIYTQLSDIEGELNGILTYDREIFKMDPDKLRETNLELYKINF